ncbi:hypothetical protein [Acinetobacter nectaris]|uniref:hypothetical protein n=1 Tax=Acinetobacter nectaris TaxID=1219382 RepID=UPI001F3B37D0|nr:hypothetical protein [Acinetobacter nectaris]MCF9033868.1 hypothetical protein [Acinetobacter nectaris]
MQRVVSRIFGLLMLLSASAWAVEPTSQTTPIPQTQPVANSTKPAPNSSTTPTPQVIKTNGSAPLVEPNSPAQLAQQKAEDDLKMKALVKNQEVRMQQLEKANLDALSQNQALQLKNDNLGVQVQVLQSERTAQLFMYGAATLAIGVILGFVLAGYIYTKRRRQW